MSKSIAPIQTDLLELGETRKKTLEELAEKVARKVEKTRRSITLDPMKPYERKIIHRAVINSIKLVGYKIH